MSPIPEYLTEHPGSSGAEISKGTGIGTATLYPALAKLEANGSITSEWEQPEPRPDKPRRRLYWAAPPSPDPVA